MAEGTVTKLESRWVAFLTAVALLFGGWWLQNQYDTVLRLQTQLNEYMRHVDSSYVQKDYLSNVTGQLDRIDNSVNTRLNRIEDKLDRMRPAENKLDDKRPWSN